MEQKSTPAFFNCPRKAARFQMVLAPCCNHCSSCCLTHLQHWSVATIFRKWLCLRIRISLKVPFSAGRNLWYINLINHGILRYPILIQNWTITWLCVVDHPKPMIRGHGIPHYWTSAQRWLAAGNKLFFSAGTGWRANSQETPPSVKNEVSYPCSNDFCHSDIGL